MLIVMCQSNLQTRSRSTESDSAGDRFSTPGQRQAERRPVCSVTNAQWNPQSYFKREYHTHTHTHTESVLRDNRERASVRERERESERERERERESDFGTRTCRTSRRTTQSSLHTEMWWADSCLILSRLFRIRWKDSPVSLFSYAKLARRERSDHPYRRRVASLIGA